MDPDQLKAKIITIVTKCNELKDQHTSETHAPVNYACVFSHSARDFGSLTHAASKMGSMIKETPTGPIFLIEAISTVAGDLRILKIRKPFADKPQLGYADFTPRDYPAFKKKYLSEEGFKLTIRETYEMIGLKDDAYDVLTYFANPPIDKLLGIK